MAEIQVEGPQVGSQPVSPQNVPMDIATPAAFGEPVGESLSVGAEIASKIHYDQVAQFNQLKTMDAMNQLHSWTQSAIHDPKTGLLNQNLGPDAPGAVDKTIDAHDQEISRISNSLSNDQQKDMFMRASAEQKYALQNHLNAYEDGQLKKYAAETTAATVTNSIQAAVNARTAPPDVMNGPQTDFEIDKGITAIRTQGKALGQPQAYTDMQVDKYKSSVYYALGADAVANKDKGYVKQLLEEHGDEMEPSQRTALRNSVKTQDLQDDAQDEAYTILSHGKNGQPIALSDALNEIDNNPKLRANAELHDAVLHRVLQSIELRRKSVLEDQTHTWNDFESSMLQGRSIEEIEGTTDYQSLTGDQQRSLKMRANQIDKQMLPPDGTSYFYKLRNILVSNPDVAADVDLEKDRANMSLHDFNELQDMKTGYVKQQTTAEGKNAKTVSAEIREKVSNELLSMNGISPKIDSGYPENTAKVVNFKHLFDRAIQAEELKTKRPLTNEETFDVGKKLFINEVYKDSAGGDVTGPKPIDNPNMANRVFNISQIPADDRTQIVNGLQTRKIPVTAENILQGYNDAQWLKADPNGYRNAHRAIPVKGKPAPPRTEREMEQDSYASSMGL